MHELIDFAGELAHAQYADERKIIRQAIQDIGGGEPYSLVDGPVWIVAAWSPANDTVFIAHHVGQQRVVAARNADDLAKAIRSKFR